MKIGVLDESVIKRVVTEILIDRPEVINVFVDGINLVLESVDLDSLVEFLEREHGLHLIVNGDSYMVASSMNEGLAQDAAEAGAKAADAASSGLISNTKAFMKKKREEVGEPATESEKEDEAAEEAAEVSEKGEAEEETIDKFRGLKAMSKEMNPETMKQRVIGSKELEKMLQKDPKFVQLLKDLVGQAEEEEGEEEFVRVPKRALKEE